MKIIDNNFVKTNLYKIPKNSHKGENGKLTIIGGSKLFHGASLWALKTASRIVDMVYYVSVEQNLKLAMYLNRKLYDFITVPFGKEDDFIAESEAILVGPGMVRGSKKYTGTGESGKETRKIIMTLFKKFPEKKWVLDAGALQLIKIEELKKLDDVLITPHKKEFEKLFDQQLKEMAVNQLKALVQQKAKQYNCLILLKGKIDIICSSEKCLINKTGNEGMTKGGTGDVLAGLTAALSCKNDLLTAGAVAVYVNGLAGDELYQKVGPYFNASDLCNQIPKTLAGLTR